MSTDKQIDKVSTGRPENTPQMVYVTTPNRTEAMSIAKAVVKDRLAACANVIDGMSSVYWWQGDLQDGNETVLILKTRRDLVTALTERIKALHSYDCPCVVALNLEGGNAEYFNWILKETR